MNLDFTDRIEIGISGAATKLAQALASNRDYIVGETLAVTLNALPLAGVEGTEVEIGDDKITLFVRRQSC